MNVRPRGAADQAAARAFLARRNSSRVARPRRTPPSPGRSGICRGDSRRADAGDAHIVPARTGGSAVLTLHASEQWHGTGTALVEAAGQLARRQR